MSRKSKSKQPRESAPTVPEAQRVPAAAAAAPEGAAAAPPAPHRLDELQERVSSVVAAKAFDILIEIGSLDPECVIDPGEKNVEAWLCLVRIHGLAGDPDLKEYQRFTETNKPGLIAAFEGYVAAGGELHLRDELEWFLGLHGYGPHAAAIRLPWPRKLHELQAGEMFHVERLRGAILTLTESTEWADHVQLPPGELEKLGDLEGFMRDALETTTETPDLSEKDRLALRVLKAFRTALDRPGIVVRGSSLNG